MKEVIVLFLGGFFFVLVACFGFYVVACIFIYMMAGMMNGLAWLIRWLFPRKGDQ